MIYATAAKGYRAGGSNALNATTDAQCQPSLHALGLSAVPEQYNSDKLWSYEIGAKDSFFEHKLAVQASAYYIDWNGIQTNLSLPSCGLSFYTNAGKAVSRGFDLQIAAVPIEGLKLSVNAAYTDAYYPNASYGAPSSDGTLPLQIFSYAISPYDDWHRQAWAGALVLMLLILALNLFVRFLSRDRPHR